MRKRETLLAYAFVSPAVLLVIAFVIWPTVKTFVTSLTNVSLSQPGMGPFCGLDNYRALASDPDFARSAGNTALFTLVVVPLQTGLALLLALWAARPQWPSRALRVAIFAPTVLSLTVLSVVWKLLCEPVSRSGSGLFNGLLLSLNLPAQPFLTSPDQALGVIVIMSVWQGVGLQMLVFCAALQQVPEPLYQAAELDGAGRWHRFWNVTLPGIAPTAVFVVVITTVLALKLFVQPFLMTRGGPQGSTMSMVQYIYETAFVHRDLGLACAAGSVFFVAVSVITLALRRASRAAEAL
jgi:ABC-type sugar transport system permease subunit